MDITVDSGQIGTPLLTLVADDIATVTFHGPTGTVEVISDGAGPLWWTSDGTEPAEGHGWFIPSMGTDERRLPNPKPRRSIDPAAVTTIRLWSPGTPQVRVQRSP